MRLRGGCGIRPVNRVKQLQLLQLRKSSSNSSSHSDTGNCSSSSGGTSVIGSSSGRGRREGRCSGRVGCCSGCRCGAAVQQQQFFSNFSFAVAVACADLRWGAAAPVERETISTKRMRSCCSCVLLTRWNSTSSSVSCCLALPGSNSCSSISPLFSASSSCSTGVPGCKTTGTATSCSTLQSSSSRRNGGSSRNGRSSNDSSSSCSSSSSVSSSSSCLSSRNDSVANRSRQRPFSLTQSNCCCSFASSPRRRRNSSSNSCHLVSEEEERRLRLSSSFLKCLPLFLRTAAEKCCSHAAVYSRLHRCCFSHLQQQQQLPQQQQQRQQRGSKKKEKTQDDAKEEGKERWGVKAAGAGRAKETPQQQQEQYCQEELLLRMKYSSSFRFLCPPAYCNSRNGDVHALPSMRTCFRAPTSDLPSSWGVRTLEFAARAEALLRPVAAGARRSAHTTTASERKKYPAAAEVTPAAAAAGASAGEKRGKLPAPACSGKEEEGAAEMQQEEQEEEEEETEEEKKLLWRTTKKRWIDFRLDPASRARLQLIHAAVMGSPPVQNEMSRDELLLLLKLPGTEAQQSVLAAAREKFLTVFFPLDTLKRRARYLLSTILPAYEDSEYLYTYFEIDKDDLCNRLYFLLLHVWLLHRRLLSLGEEGLKTELWEALWDFYRALLSRENVSEMRLNSFVKEMQNTTTGFCLSLDEAMDEKAAAGEVAHRIWFVLFRADEKQRYSPAVLNLTAYLFRTAHFVAALPPEVFLRGSFTWPRWPPPALPLPRNQRGFFDTKM